MATAKVSFTSVTGDSNSYISSIYIFANGSLTYLADLYTDTDKKATLTYDTYNNEVFILVAQAISSGVGYQFTASSYKNTAIYAAIGAFIIIIIIIGCACGCVACIVGYWLYQRHVR